MAIFECLYSFWMFFFIFEYSSFEYSYFASFWCLTFPLNISSLMDVCLSHQYIISYGCSFFTKSSWISLLNILNDFFCLHLNDLLLEWSYLCIFTFCNFEFFNWILFSHKIFWMVGQSRLPDWLSLFYTFLNFIEYIPLILNASLASWMTLYIHFWFLIINLSLSLFLDTFHDTFVFVFVWDSPQNLIIFLLIFFFL